MNPEKYILYEEVELSLISFLCFNGISTFVSYSMPNHPSRRTVVMIFNPELGGKGGSYLSKGYLSESERYSMTGVRTRLLQFCSPVL